MAESSEDVTVTLELESGYRFQVDFGDPAWPRLLVDEPRPLAEASGPNASRLLAAAVGNCLSASLLFCLRKAKAEVGSLRTTVRATTARNQRGRLRVTRLAVSIEPQLLDPATDVSRVHRCLDLFEDFCVVTESVRGGLAVDVRVEGLSPREETPG